MFVSRFAPVAAASLLCSALLAAGCDDGSVTSGTAGSDGSVDAGAPGAPGPDEDLPNPGGTYDPSCSTCHGNETSPAPPKNLAGDTDPGVRGVGAHRAHLDTDQTWHRVVACVDCHKVPEALGDPGHIDDGDNRAELTFSALASSGGLAPAFGGDSCSNVYCHGTTLSGGSLTTPTFTVTDGSQDSCGTCHGFPPLAPHPTGTDCGACHQTMKPGDNAAFLDPGSHINGVLDVVGGGEVLACDSCHGGNGEPAPPRDLDGDTDPTARGVGAHAAHLGTSTLYREIVCVNCHVVPTELSSPGHLDGDDVAELSFDGLNPTATYAVADATCSNLYCHGDGRANNGTMVWNQPETLSCAGCHSATTRGLGGEHGEHDRYACGECHQQVVNGTSAIIAPERHINGVRDVSMARGGTFDPATRRCTNLACHGTERW